MQSTHCCDLDHASAGFHSGGNEPGYDNVVISRYFNQYFPAAAQLGQQLRNRPGGTERLVVEIVSRLRTRFPMAVCCLDEPGQWASRLTAQGVEVVALQVGEADHVEDETADAAQCEGVRRDLGAHRRRAAPWCGCL